MAKKMSKTRAKRPVTSSEPNGEIEFRDPPPPGRQALTLPVETLKKHPGKWAVIAKKNNKSSAASATTNLRRRLEAESVDGFEVRAGEDEVFARYVG